MDHERSHNAQHNDSQHNGLNPNTQRKWYLGKQQLALVSSFIALSVAFFIVMLGVVLLYVALRRKLKYYWTP